jgi:hypothetical protein
MENSFFLNGVHVQLDGDFYHIGGCSYLPISEKDKLDIATKNIKKELDATESANMGAARFFYDRKLPGQ